MTADKDPHDLPQAEDASVCSSVLFMCAFGALGP